MALKTEMLRCFVTVAREGNLAAAADSLGRSPSAVSMMLKQMEDHLGSPLFEGERKGRLSKLGEYAFELASDELRQFDRTTRAIESFAKADAGLVRFACVPSFAVTFLPDILKEFILSHPGVRIELWDMDSQSVATSLSRNQIDLGICSPSDDIAGIDRTALHSDEFGVVCHVNNPLAKKTSPIEWSDIRGQEFISNGLCAEIRDQEFIQINDAARILAHNSTSLYAMVGSDMGITILPRPGIDRMNDQLVFLPLANSKAVRTISLMFRTDRSMSPAIKAFHNCVLARSS